MLSGGAGINMGTIGALARALAPAGGVAPLAGQVEYGWPISHGEEPGGIPDDEVLLALLGAGDLRDQVRDLAMTTPAAELRDAFRLAAGLPEWADGTCAAVEREIAAGRPGEAVKGVDNEHLRTDPPAAGRGAAGPGCRSGQHGHHRPGADLDPQ